MAVQLTGSVDGLGNITASANFFGTASYAASASLILNSVEFITSSFYITSSISGARTFVFEKGDGTEDATTLKQVPQALNTTMSLSGSDNQLVIYDSLGGAVSASIDRFSTLKAVNGDTGSNGNIPIQLAKVIVGLSSSIPVSANDTDMFIVAGETGSASGSNGDSYIYSTASVRWFNLTPDSQKSNDARYLVITGSTQTLTGNLFLSGSNPSASLEASTKDYADQLVSSAITQVSSSITASSWGRTLIVDNFSSHVDIHLPSATTVGSEMEIWILRDPSIYSCSLITANGTDTMNGQTSGGTFKPRSVYSSSLYWGGEFIHAMVYSSNNYLTSIADTVKTS